MMDHRGLIANIVARSKSLAERTKGTNPYSENTEIQETRLDLWCRLVADGDDRLFDDRLGKMRLTRDSVVKFLSSIQPEKELQLPSWGKLIQEILDNLSQNASKELVENTKEVYRYIDSTAPIPFEETFHPFIQSARQQLSETLGDKYDLLTPRAHSQLERYLLTRLSHLCSLSLYLKFSVLRSLQEANYSRLFTPQGGSRKEGIYYRFTTSMLTGEWKGFFDEFPVLARLVGTQIEYWVENCLEFLQRYVDDQDTLQELLKSEHAPGHIENLKPGLSDPHDHGRTVIIAKLENGNFLVYKPRSVKIEWAYNELLSAINDRDLPLKLKTLDVLDRDTYGWMAFCEPSECDSAEAVGRYFQRAGMLLCILYVLEGTDIHIENLIASGEYPVVVDLEMLFSPIESDETARRLLMGSDGSSSDLILNSVMRTGLLPGWGVGPRGQSFDLSAMGGLGEQTSPFEKQDFEDINSDDMTLRSIPSAFQAQLNNPRLNGVEQSPEEYVKDLLGGFRQMYMFLIENRETLLNVDGLLTNFDGNRIRYAMRYTMLYGDVLRKSCHPELLRDGVDRSIYLDLLSHSMVTLPAAHPYWRMLELEKQALWHMDVPLFEARTGDRAVFYFGDVVHEDFFRLPGMDSVRNRLMSLNEQDLEFQSQIIRGCLAARYIDDVHTGGISVHEQMTPISLDEPREIIDFIEGAQKVYEGLRQQAIRLTDDCVTWFGGVYLSNAQKSNYQPLGTGLYDGSLGIGLFLSALFSITADQEHKMFALDTLRSLRRKISDPESVQAIAQRDGLGGGGGLGSLIYGLSMSGQSLGMVDLLADAERVAQAINEEEIKEDDKFDFLNGSAGAILGLLTLNKSRPSDKWIQKAILCGDHLVASREETDVGQRSWKTMHGMPLTGFSHGAAGIAYALLQLYDQTREDRFLEAAQEALAYERALFDKEARNWPDLRDHVDRSNGNQIMVGWCHGAPGIGLGRLGGLSIMNDRESVEEVEIALDTTLKYGIGPTDHLCCGNAGRIEFLLSAGERLSNQKLTYAADSFAAEILERAHQIGYYQFNPGLIIDLNNPGLFSGVSGIGYTYLRLVAPTLIPSVLLWV